MKVVETRWLIMTLNDSLWSEHDKHVLILYIVAVIFPYNKSEWEHIFPQVLCERLSCLLLYVHTPPRGFM